MQVGILWSLTTSSDFSPILRRLHSSLQRFDQGVSTGGVLRNVAGHNNTPTGYVAWNVELNFCLVVDEAEHNVLGGTA